MEAIVPSSYAAKEKQAARLSERRAADVIIKRCADMDIIVLPGVYGTSTDTELMIDTVRIASSETFVEIGCGTGAVSLALARRAKSGLGVDINEVAVRNSRENADRLGQYNVTFAVSDVFSNVEGKFDVVVFNPPYSSYAAADEVDRMFWDPGDEAKKQFFASVKNHLAPGGRVYFGWTNFADIDIDLPLQLASSHGFALQTITQRPSRGGEFMYYVLEFIAK